MSVTEFERTLHAAREESISWYKDWDFEGEEIWVPSRAGEIRCRMYLPDMPATSRLPVFFDFHGGGWAVHQCEVDQPFCLKIVQRLGIAVISVDYRLAPEFKCPAPIEDAIDVITYFYTNAERYGFDPLRMGIGGHSAGGQITLATALYAKETQIFPLRCMVLDYPAVTVNTMFEDAREKQGELTNYQKEFMALCNIFDQCKYASPAQKRDYHYNPICAEPAALEGLPPAVMIICENDLLRFDDLTFASKLMEAGVETSVRLFKNVVHGFTADLYYTPEAEEAHQWMIAGIAKYLLKS